MRDSSCKSNRVLASREHWETFHSASSSIRLTLPRRLLVSVNDLLSLLGGESLHGKYVLEVGYAPGKILAWCASQGASVTGIDFAKDGTAAAESLFAAVELPGTHVTADIFSNHECFGRFDLVYSVGVIEHFEDPSAIIEAHLRCCKPGGKAILLFPNYGGLYGRMQRFFDSENLSIHNLEMMTRNGLTPYLNSSLIRSYRLYRYGRPHLELVSLERRAGRIGRHMKLVANLAGWMMPWRCGPLSPNWVLEIQRASS